MTNQNIITFEKTKTTIKALTLKIILLVTFDDISPY